LSAKGPVNGSSALAGREVEMLEAALPRTMGGLPDLPERPQNSVYRQMLESKIGGWPPGLDFVLAIMRARGSAAQGKLVKAASGCGELSAKQHGLPHAQRTRIWRHNIDD